ncbi:holin family protein [Salipiger abyssi]|uniref:holin family protein n=1 Tax=Salipiger abyssi TaxID=1250539 RepID=UPI001A8F2E30|nr:holin family protein [Salipiger abyssi]MBN9889072.1 holin family protein [Salipiger abyssi]
MGMIDRTMGLLFGGGGTVLRDTAEVFRVNAEAQAAREAGLQGKALEQFAAEFLGQRPSRFDRLMDALNRVPRPAMALGTLGLFVSAMVDPVWFAERMTGIALVPEPLWWLLAVIVGFYFGARHQTKGQQFRREMAATVAAVPEVMGQLRGLEALRAQTEPEEREETAPNPALAEWRAARS